MAARALQSTSRQRRFFMLLGAIDLFRMIGRFPPAFVGVPYDEQIELAGFYQGPVTFDTATGFVPAGLTLEASIDGLFARLHGTPMGFILISGTLPGCMVGLPYSARLQVSGLGAETVTDVDVVAGDMPSWMSTVWHSDTSEIEFLGTPT